MGGNEEEGEVGRWVAGGLLVAGFSSSLGWTFSTLFWVVMREIGSIWLREMGGNEEEGERRDWSLS
jgi:hypothetical protein